MSAADEPGGPLELLVEPGEAGRVDRVLAGRFPGATRRRLAELFAARRVRIDGRVARKGDAAAAGARITVAEPPAGAAARRPVATPDAPLVVLYQDEHLVAVAKPAGPPSHPLRAGERGTLANALVARFPECAGAGADPREAGLAHRLDAGTSGVLLAARDAETWAALRRSFSTGQVIKAYLALVHGHADAGASTAPIAQAGGRAVLGGAAALPAETSWTVVRRFAAHTLVRCVAHTGRMHQVRAHLAGAGHPVVGDARYGPTAPAAPAALVGHFLHAVRVELAHPRTGQPLAVEAPLPPDREAALASLAID